ncbi:MAG: family 20 glycosylhydrolase [Bryobacteraceae bacterium]
MNVARLLLIALLPLGSGLAGEPVLMPRPEKVQHLPGAMRVDASFRLAFARPATPPRLERAADRFLTRLTAQTGISLSRARALSAGAANLIIDCAQAADPAVEKLGVDESYRLQVNVEQARLSAATVTGAMRGLQTFLQLVSVDAKGFSAPAVTIEDKPRFGWRGLLMDVTSHFMPVPVIERTLDTMEAVKLNVFHWHLTDDQGFRVESRVFPKLHTLGTEGDFYTQAEIRHIVAYAHDRGIRVLPEFDMPGHSGTWLIGYPELASVPGPYSIIHTFGVYDPALDPTKDAVYAFIDRLLGEMTALFPDDYFHIGGDEVNGRHWKQSAAIQAFIQKQNLGDEAGLQAYFNRRVVEMVRKHGRKMMGWDEVLHPKLPREVMVESWQNHESLATAAKQGYQGLLAFGYYLDHLDSAADYYRVDPFGGPVAALPPDARRNILGGEACMWTEFVSPETIDSRMWPKSAAVAERLWSPGDVTDVADMYRRLDGITHRLDHFGALHNRNYEPMLRRLAPLAPVDALRTLADALDPTGIEHREVFQRYTQSTQLNRLVDAARGDSETVRGLEAAIRAWVESRDAAREAEIRRVLALWRDNHARLAAYFAGSALLAEYQPLSEDLARLGALGLEAMGRVRTRDAAWVAAQVEKVAGMTKPRLEVVLAAARPVRILVEAVGRP